MSINTPHGKMKTVYTDYSTAAMYDKFYCAKVSHHHYWFSNYADLMDFIQHDSEYDSRMTVSNPATRNHCNW